MVKIKCIQKQDELTRFLTSDQKSFNFDIEYISVQNFLDPNYSESSITILFISLFDFEKQIEELSKKIENLKEHIHVYIAVSMKNFKKLEKLQELINYKSVQGYIDTDLNIIYYPELINKIENLITQKDDLININKNLKKLTDEFKSQLKIIKRLHEKFVPKKKQSYRGLDFVSKYKAGSSSGGEFFDIFQSGDTIMLLLSSSNSYIVTSTILTVCSDIEGKTINQESLKNLLSTISTEIDEISEPNENINTEIFISFINLNTLVWEGYNIGRTSVFSNSNSNIVHNNLNLSFDLADDSYFKIKLERNKKYILASPGILKNPSSKLALEEFKSLPQKSSSEVVDNVFFKLHNDSQDNFLTYDAILISIEVDPNVLVKA